MRDVVFAMELRGRAAPVEGSPNTLTAKTGGRGPHGETVTFETVGIGHLGPSPIPGLQWGAVIWRITTGDGTFAGATGYITSNFTVSAEGEVVDNHYVRMVLP